MDESIKTSINIAGRNYPIIIEPEEVQKIKDIELDLKSRYLQSTSNYPNLDAQDHLAMVLLKLTMVENEKNTSFDEAQITEKVENLINKIENHLD